MLNPCVPGEVRRRNIFSQYNLPWTDIILASDSLPMVALCATSTMPTMQDFHDALPMRATSHVSPRISAKMSAVVSALESGHSTLLLTLMLGSWRICCLVQLASDSRNQPTSMSAVCDTSLECELTMIFVGSKPMTLARLTTFAQLSSSPNAHHHSHFSA